MWTRAFWVDAAERATKSAAQALILLWGADALDLRAVDWAEAAGVGSGAALLSVVMSVASSRVGSKTSASAVK